VARGVIREIHKFDPGLAVTDVVTLGKLVSESVALRKLPMFSVWPFAGFAVLLAALGVYAVMSYAVRLRPNEIGARIALGARPRDIWRLIVDNGARPIRSVCPDEVVLGGAIVWSDGHGSAHLRVAALLLAWVGLVAW
jgi:hypothetical protein